MSALCLNTLLKSKKRKICINYSERLVILGDPGVKSRPHKFTCKKWAVGE